MVNKQSAFAYDEIELATFAKALSHPARIAIIKILVKRNACICGEIVDELPLSQPTVSQHLKELKKAGLIQGQVEGVKSCYCLDHKGIKRFREMVGQLFEPWDEFPEGNLCC